MSEKGLVWSPVKEFLKSQFAQSDTLLTIIAPFIQLEALKDLLSVANDYKDLNIVTRWRAEDIISGVSDIEIYPFLREKKINLFYHDNIHLKLYVFNSNSAFSSSANITKKGLGDSKVYNIEIGSLVDINANDWFQIHKLLNESTLITDSIYEKVKKYVLNNKRTPPPLPKLILEDTTSKDFSLKSLPKTETPQELYEFYKTINNSEHNKEKIKNSIHDLVIFKVPIGQDEQAFYASLGDNFRNQEFVKAAILFIKKKCEERKNERKNGVRFGEMSQWIQDHCSDSPMPYRAEIKTDTRMLYNWLQYFIIEITWSQPGYSQIIYWACK